MDGATLRRMLLALALVLLSAAGPAGAAGEWAGTWEMRWRGTGGHLVFEQDGDEVTGSYALYQARIAGRSRTDGRAIRLEGEWTVGARSGKFVAVMDPDRRTFTGRFEDGEWWTGTRTDQPPFASPIGQRTPRDAFTRFVSACNLAISGIDEAWGVALGVVDFGPASTSMPRTQQIHLLRTLFAVIDLTTFRYWSIADSAPGTDAVELRLEQARTGIPLALSMKRGTDGDWRIVMPGDAELREARTALLALHGGKPPAADAYLRLQNPRDTMRAFLAGMADWNGAGRALAMSTLDLSALPEPLRKSSGEISAQFLRRVLDHIGLVGLQAIPNDGSSREPYVHFVHGAGRIVIAPKGSAADAPWQFTHETVATIRDVYRATESLPPPIATPPGLVPESTFFSLRAWVAKSAPVLLGRLREVEYWQVLFGLLAVSVAVVIGRAGSALVCAGLRRLPGKLDEPRWFRWALVVLIAITLLLPVPGALAIAEGFREYSYPFWGVVACLALAGVAWHLLKVIGSLLAALAERTATPTDDIVVTLLLATARLGIVVSCALGISWFLSIPTSNLLAGLGIGGLALAFASRETLSNVFGAGILVVDRPFRRGDWIKTGDIEGAVEAVGVRSTRVRTAHDSVVFVPNGKLVDSTINNLGTRRNRLLKLQLLVTSGGTPESLDAFADAIRQRIAGDPEFVASRTGVGVGAIQQGGIAVDVTSYLTSNTDQGEEAARHALLLDIVRLASERGLSLGNGMARAAT